MLEPLKLELLISHPTRYYEGREVTEKRFLRNHKRFTGTQRRKTPFF